MTIERKLAVIDVKPGSNSDTQSGLQMMRPRIYGAYEEPQDRKGGTAVIVMHPTSNFMGHYMISPLAERGVACMGLNSRYSGNDSVLLMERVLQDLGAGVRFLRGLGYGRVVLFGNSGGAALAAFYQAQAESLTITSTPAGDRVDLVPDDLPPVEGIVLAAAHAGRSRLLEEWIDPSVREESDPQSLDPALDVYDRRNGPPFTDEWLRTFRAAQVARRDRIETWVRQRLQTLRADRGPAADEAFIVHRTHADPRFVDLSLDANDRAPGSIWGDPRTVNYAGNAMGRYTSLTAFLSQWAACSQADGPTNLAKTTVPVQFLEYTADASTFPSTAGLWCAAGGDRVEAHRILGANHYLAGQPKLVGQVADLVSQWAARL